MDSWQHSVYRVGMKRRKFRTRRTEFPAIQCEQRLIESEVDQAANRVAYAKGVGVGFPYVLRCERVAVIAVVTPGVRLPARRA